MAGKATILDEPGQDLRKDVVEGVSLLLGQRAERARAQSQSPVLECLRSLPANCGETHGNGATGFRYPGEEPSRFEPVHHPGCRGLGQSKNVG